MTTALTRLAGSAFEITLTIPWSDIKAVYDKVFDELAAEIEVEGFRKGKAPKDLIAGKVDKSKVYGEVINRILPEAYSKALQEHGIKPVISPRIHIEKGEEETEWQFLIRSAERPTVTLGDYKEAVKEILAKDKIWTPGKDVEEKDEKGETDDQKRTKKLNTVIEKLLEVVKVDLADIFAESEQSRLMSQLIDDVRQAGLTFEQYLASTNTTKEAIAEKFKNQAETSLKLEFILEAIADDLNVVISKEEVDAVISKETDPDRKKALEEQKYMITAVLRREATISKLLAL